MQRSENYNQSARGNAYGAPGLYVHGRRMKAHDSTRLIMTGGILSAFLLVTLAPVVKRIDGWLLYASYIGFGLGCYFAAERIKRMPIRILLPFGTVAWVGLCAYCFFLLK